MVHLHILKLLLVRLKVIKMLRKIYQLPILVKRLRLYVHYLTNILQFYLSLLLNLLMYLPLDVQRPKYVAHLPLSYLLLLTFLHLLVLHLAQRLQTRILTQTLLELLRQFALEFLKQNLRLFLRWNPLSLSAHIQRIVLVQSQKLVVFFIRNMWKLYI